MGLFSRKTWLAMAGVLVVGVVAGAGVWTSRCPCDRTPGAYLLGTMVDEPVTDWQFANDVPSCQIQISANGLPHAINVTCMATADGRLFLSCSTCEGKYWSSHVEPGEPARLRLNGRVYPVELNRVTDQATLDQAWSARVAKLQAHPAGVGTTPAAGAPRPETWWSFHARSRTS
ncbi:MAG: hypothetical protein AB7I25_08485 [Vicinamibacterales bacterium]